MTAIGIDLGGTTVKLGVVENRQDVIYRNTCPSPHDPAAMVELLCDMIIDARARYPGTKAAISTAGTIDAVGNVEASQLGFNDAPIGPMLFAKLGERIPIENDGICALMAEHSAGALQGVDFGLMVLLGTGIGGGVIIGGKPYRGFQGRHAELGHMITHVDGVRCPCGQSGCWECYASASGLSRMAGGLSPRKVIDGVRHGEYQTVWRQYLHEVAQGLVGLCSIFFPEVIVIGGGLSNAGELVIDGIRDAIYEDPGFQAYFSHTEIRAAHFLNDAGIIGAAALTKEAL